MHKLRIIPLRKHSTAAVTSSRLRTLLRETAQPVAVVTSSLPGAECGFHGATLSSFSSIAMHPHPLVAFSLRIPSRMATTLNSRSNARMVINILSAAQHKTAILFSRPDLHPRPFDDTPHFLNEDGIPVLSESLGALTCSLVSRSWPLHALDKLHVDEQGRSEESCEVEEDRGVDGVVSELFIGRVLRVENIVETLEDERRTLPLVYHRRTYTTTSTPLTSTSPLKKF